MTYQNIMLLVVILVFQSCESTLVIKDDTKKHSSGGSGTVIPNPDTTSGTFALTAVPPQEVILATSMSDIQITPRNSTIVSGCIFSGDKINGVILDEDSCRISGKPLEIKTNSTIYVQAYNSEEISTILPIKITSYSTEDGIIADQKVFTTRTGAVSKVISTKGTCSIENPANLNGLTFNASTCTLSGTPSQLTAGKQLKFKITHSDGAFDYRYIDLVVDEKFTHEGKQYSKLDLVMKVDLTDSLDRSFYLPIKPGFNYDFTIDWGDGQLDYINTFYNEKLYHIYEADVEDPIIVISGKMPGIGGTPGIYDSITPYISEIINLGDLKYKDLSSMFISNSYMQEFYPHKADRFTDLSEVRSIAYMFSNTRLVNVNLSNIEFLNLSSAIAAFNSNLLLQTVNFSGAKFPNLKFMQKMFSYSGMTTINFTGATLPSLVNLESTFAVTAISSVDFTGFNFSKVTNIDNLVQGCVNLTSINLTTKDLSNVVTMNDAFAGTSSLVSLDLPTTNLSNVVTMNDAFAGTSSLVSLDLSNKTFAKATSARGLFYNTNIQNLNLTNTSFPVAKAIENFYFGAVNLTAYPLSIFDLSKIESLNGVFRHTSVTSLDLSNQDLSKLTSLDGLVLDSSITDLNLENANLSGLTTLSGMGYSNIIQSVSFSGANLSNVKNINNFLSYNNSLISVDFSNTNLSGVTSSFLLSSYNPNLTSIDLSNAIMPSDLGTLSFSYLGPISNMKCPVGYNIGDSFAGFTCN